MNFNKVIIKQVADSNSAAVGLEKYNRSRFPGTTDAMQVAQMPDGRFITGLDPEQSKSLGEMLGKDLSPLSKFWETYIVALSSDQDKILNGTNPYDVIAYHALTSNGFVAPSKELASYPEYLSAKYYCFIDEVEQEIDISARKKRDKAKSKLYDIAEDKDMLCLIGTYLEGNKYKKVLKAGTLYGMLADFIENKNSDNLEAFLKAMTLPKDELLFKVIIETAMRKKIIKFKEGHFYRGGVNLGKTAIEVFENLKKPDYASEFIQITEEVNNVR